MRTLVRATGAVVLSLGLCGCGGNAGTGYGPAGNTAPGVDAGTDQSITVDLNVPGGQMAVTDLDGSVTDDGFPLLPGKVTAGWSVVGGPGPVTFGNPATAQTTANFGIGNFGTFILRLKAEDGELSATDDVAITVKPLGTAMNTAPAVSAGIDQEIKVGLHSELTVGLDGTVADDGLPSPPGAVTIQWTVASAPGPVTFTDAGAANTTADLGAAFGTFVLRLRASDGDLSAKDEVSITVTPLPDVNQAPVVDAGPDQETMSFPILLDGTITDDGVPNPPGKVTATWSLLSGPGTANFGDETAADTTVSLGAPGIYVLSLSAFDGELTANDLVTITLLDDTVPSNEPPFVQAGPDNLAFLRSGTPAVAALKGVVIKDDGLPDPPKTVTSAWRKVSGPGTVLFGDLISSSGAFTTATFSMPGSYLLKLTASDGMLQASDTLTVDVLSSLNFMNLYSCTTPPGGTDGNGAGVVKINTTAEWLAFQKTYPNCSRSLQPEVMIDFSQDMVVGVVDVVQNTGGFSIVVRGIVAAGDKLQIHVLRTTPGAGCAVTQALTQPYTAVKLTKRSESLELRLETQSYDCTLPPIVID